MCYDSNNVALYFYYNLRANNVFNLGIFPMVDRKYIKNHKFHICVAIVDYFETIIIIDIFYNSHLRHNQKNNKSIC